MGGLLEKQKNYFVVGIGSLLETKSGNKTESPKRTQYCGRLKPAGDPCGELKGSSTAAHNTCHHSSIRAFPSMRTSHPWLLAPLSISSVSKGCRIPMVGLPRGVGKDPAAGVMSPAGLVLLSTVSLWQEKYQVLNLLLVLGIWME